LWTLENDVVDVLAGIPTMAHGGSYNVFFYVSRY